MREGHTITLKLIPQRYCVLRAYIVCNRIFYALDESIVRYRGELITFKHCGFDFILNVRPDRIAVRPLAILSHISAV